MFESLKFKFNMIFHERDFLRSHYKNEQFQFLEVAKLQMFWRSQRSSFGDLDEQQIVSIA